MVGGVLVGTLPVGVGTDVGGIRIYLVAVDPGIAGILDVGIEGIVGSDEHRIVVDV